MLSLTKMVKEFKYIKIYEILSRVLRHPLLQEVTLESAVQYTLDFIYIFGLPEMFADKVASVEIKNYRGELPCDLISINQVRSKDLYLRNTTDTFNTLQSDRQEQTFKVQGDVIFTSFKEGNIEVSYKSIPIDEEGFPLVIDNYVYLKALEAYIKKEAFTVLFDLGKINNAVLQNAQQSYAWAAGQLNSEFSIPSVSEMESLKRMWCSLIPKTREFDSGFKGLGNQEYLKLH